VDLVPRLIRLEVLQGIHESLDWMLLAVRRDV